MSKKLTQLSHQDIIFLLEIILASNPAVRQFTSSKLENGNWEISYIGNHPKNIKELA